MPQVSLVATLAAAVAGMMLGALWYGPRFGKAWLAASGHTEDELKRRVNPGVAYGLTFVLGLAGAPAGICWVAGSLATNYLFEGRPGALIVINGGFHAVRFTLIGLSFALLG